MRPENMTRVWKNRAKGWWVAACHRCGSHARGETWVEAMAHATGHARWCETHDH